MFFSSKSLSNSLKTSLAPIYILVGSDDFLMDDATQTIKGAWRLHNSGHSDADALEKRYIDISDATAEWEQLTADLQSRSLFAQQILYQVRYSKKTLTKNAKAHLSNVAQPSNASNLLIFQAPLCKVNDFHVFKTQASTAVVQISRLSATEFPQWIWVKLKEAFPTATREMAQLIAQYTHGNAYAAAQAIQKLSLFITQSDSLSLENIQRQLHNQCEYQAFELSDACLKGDACLAVQILRGHLKANEAPLLLWILGNEIRQLLRLQFNTTRMSLQEACRKQNLWSSKIPMYQTSSQRLSLDTLQRLHRYCLRADEYLKSGRTALLRDTLEQIALGLCGYSAVLGDV